MKAIVPKSSLKFFLLCFFLSCAFSGARAEYSNLEDYICEIGQRYYQQGDYDLALEEFKKALIINPSSKTALTYISYIEQTLQSAETYPEETKPVKMETVNKESPAIPAETRDEPKESPAVYKTEARLPFTREETMDMAMRKAAPLKPETQTTQISQFLTRLKKVFLTKQEYTPQEPRETAITTPLKTVASERQLLILDPELKINQPVEIKLEIQLGKEIVIKGNNIKRWLFTSANIISIERLDSERIKLTGQGIGNTYLHVWDDSGRWTFNVMGIPKAPIGPTLEEQMRFKEETANNFKLNYSLDWNTFEQGNGLAGLKRQSYRYMHNVGLRGGTPYGDIDSAATIQTLSASTDLTYATVGLTDGKIGPFKGFSLRGLDFSPITNNLAWPGTSVRGVYFSSPAFNNIISYETFWGQEGGGKYGNLSPGLDKPKNSYLSGLDFNFNPYTNQNYGFSVFHGWGKDRPIDTNNYGYDLNASYVFGEGNSLKTDIASDSDHLAYLLSGNFAPMTNMHITSEFRDINKKYTTITGSPYRVGELGVLSTLQYAPIEKLNINASLDIFKDRTFPAVGSSDVFNEDLNIYGDYYMNELTTMRFDYTLQNELGRVNRYRYQNMGGGISHNFELFRRINLFANYHHQENTNFSSPSSNYANEKFNFGGRIPIFQNLNYYANQEFNWLREKDNGQTYHPQAFETGIDWSDQILNTPFSGIFRFLYRDEENTQSALSFLSGEDYIEGYAELDYRPTDNIETYCSARMRNVWADNPNVNKRIEMEYRAGMRYLWDTGIHWDPIGVIDGFVFRDANSDGLMQRDDAPVEGVKLYLSKDKTQTTDLFGYYRFSNIRARKIKVNIDASTLPAGYVLTVPSSQEAGISQGQQTRINFGIASRTEISGVVFVDTNGDGQPSREDIIVQGVTLKLEDGTRAVTDSSGRYSFRRIGTGAHMVTIDLKTLPLEYMPAVPIFKKVEVFAGITYIFNVPLKKSQE